MQVKDDHLTLIDGSYGEGGGQILRTSLALSAILQKPVTIRHIRANRNNPGLRPQHLKGVEALAHITGAKVEGARIGSQTVSFVPQKAGSGHFRFEIGNGKRSAGSITLLLQTLLLPLSLSGHPSNLLLIGGTHVPGSPPFHYLIDVLFPTLRLMGINIKAVIERWGWYPKGGGVVRIEIIPAVPLRPVTLLERGPLRRIYGLSATSNLPWHVAERQRDDALKRIRLELKTEAEIEILHEVPGEGPGSFFFLVAESEKGVAGFSSLGERGKKAEELAKEAVDLLIDYLGSMACVDAHLADQLAPFMALAEGSSSLTTQRITHHLMTNLWVIQQLLETKTSLLGTVGHEGRVDMARA